MFQTALASVLLLSGLALQGFCAEDDWLVPLGLPPKASPRRISSGEAVPPLPLPATPLRRSERKRNPAPSKLLGKVVWGETASFVHSGGQKAQVADWNQCPSDVQQLLHKASGPLGVNYGHDTVSLPSFDGDPAKLPAILFSGSRSINLSDEQLNTLRNYVLNGGMIVADNIAGSPYFYSSFKKAMRKAFPELAIRTIPGDHPVYHVLYDIDDVFFPSEGISGPPELEGIYVGSRIGVLISKYGMGCGWDNHNVPYLDEARYYDVESANKLGLNILCYAVGYSAAARKESRPELFGARDGKAPTDELVFAQIKHEGAWNVHPGAATALLNYVRNNTSVRVNLKRAVVNPATDDISDYSFLYLTGLDDFSFQPREIEALRDFLRKDGVLLINNGLGLSRFDKAVRRELKKILPEATLTMIPRNHPVYRSFFDITGAGLTPELAAKEIPIDVPVLECIAVDGDLRVIYSPYDMEMGWQDCDYPAAVGYDCATSMRMGVNTTVYAMTH